MISNESYVMVQKMANKFAYGNTRSLMFDQFVSVGVEALQQAVETYQEGSNIKFSTYLYRCVMNAMINEKERMKRHDLPENDDANVNLEAYNGALDEIRDERIVDTLRLVIRKAVKNNERNAQIVELSIGIDRDAMELKDIAVQFNLSHESVRLIREKAMNAIRCDKQAKTLLYSFVG